MESFAMGLWQRTLMLEPGNKSCFCGLWQGLVACQLSCFSSACMSSGVESVGWL